jgi:hypothetical protein
VKTAQQASQNWQNAAGRATTDYVAGVNATTKDQAALAVAQQATLLQNFNNAVTSGRWAAGVQRRGTAYWKTQTEKKAPNYSAGYSAGAANQASAMVKVMAAIAQGVASLPPRGDLNQNLQRVVSLDTYLHSQKGTLGAS